MQKRRQSIKTDGFASRFESQVALKLSNLGIDFEYETLELPYTKTYKPDFILNNGIILEVKGVLDQQDRDKMARVRKAHPEANIWFVFMAPHRKCPGLKKMTHAEWADKNGYRWISFEDLTLKVLK